MRATIEETTGPAVQTEDADVYFSADVETDGSIPGVFSMLAVALVEAGTFDGHTFRAPASRSEPFYCELKPISDRFDPEALAVNGLNRERLLTEGVDPDIAMTAAASWVRKHSEGRSPVLVAYPLSFDWMWLYWYFVRFSKTGSPFNHSRCFDVKTAFAVKADRPVTGASREELRRVLGGIQQPHTHKALDDAREQAEIFGRLFTWQRNR